MKTPEFTITNQQNAKYTTFNLQKAFGWKVDTMKEWMIRGFVVPAIRANGIGTKNLFSRFDIYLAKLFVDLLKQGLSREGASGVTKSIYAQLTMICTNGHTLDDELAKMAYVVVVKNGERSQISWLSLEDLDKLSQIVKESSIDSVLIVNFWKIVGGVDCLLTR